MSSATNSRMMLPAILNAGRVMPKKRKIAWPVRTKIIRTHAAMMQASRDMRMRASGPSFGVIARKAGTVAIGSMITNSDSPESTMYLSRSIGFGRFHARREDRVRHSMHDFFVGRNDGGENAAEIRAFFGSDAVHKIIWAEAN